MYVLLMGMPDVRDAVTALRAAHDTLAACDIGALTADELFEVADELQTLTCQLPTQSHRLLARLQIETTAITRGAKTWRDVLATRWRISTGEAGRRLNDAKALGPRATVDGTPQDPELPATAIAQAHGSVTPEHVAVIQRAMTRLPGFVDPATRARIELNLVRTAIGTGPKALEDDANRTLFLLDQDGPEPDDTERQRRRGLSMGKQGRDGMTPFSGTLTPEAWAVWEAIFARYAAPGMCNPDDEHPCTSGTPSQAQIDGDHRSLAQRQHDALIAVGRIALMNGQLGTLNGLPVSVIIRTTLDDLMSLAGVGVTGGGTMVPIADVIRMGAHAHWFMAIFDRSTGKALDLFRSKRVASPDQRIMLFARDGGCTKPGCSVPAYGCQVHHATADWADGGLTNVDDLALACGPDNRMVGPNGWTTRINERGDVEWIPPPHLDTGQTRVNDYHRPERLHTPPQPEPGPELEPECEVESDGAFCNSNENSTPPTQPTPSGAEGNSIRDSACGETSGEGDRASGGTGGASDGSDASREATDADVHPLIRLLLDYESPPPTRRHTVRAADPNCNPFTGEREQPNGPQANDP